MVRTTIAIKSTFFRCPHLPLPWCAPLPIIRGMAQRDPPPDRTHTREEREARGRVRLPSIWLEKADAEALDAYISATGATVKEAVSAGVRLLPRPKK